MYLHQAWAQKRLNMVRGNLSLRCLKLKWGHSALLSPYIGEEELEKIEALLSPDVGEVELRKIECFLNNILVLLYVKNYVILKLWFNDLIQWLLHVHFYCVLSMTRYWREAVVNQQPKTSTIRDFNEHRFYLHNNIYDKLYIKYDIVFGSRGQEETRSQLGGTGRLG